MATGVASAANGPDKAPIIVGGTGSLAVTPGIAEGFKAGILRFNKAGGLDGRTIKFVGYLDDGLNPSTALNNVQRLVQVDGVMAVVPMWSQGGSPAAGTFLAQHKVPFIGFAGSGEFVAAPKWGYGISGFEGNTNVQRLIGMTQLLAATGHTKTPGKVKIANIAVDFPTAALSNVALAGSAKFAGMDVVYVKAPIPVTGATNYAPYAQEVIASGANLVYEDMGPADAIGLAAALKSAGYRGAIVNGVTYTPGEVGSQPNEAAALDGVYVEATTPVGENPTPAIKQEKKDLQAIDEKPILNEGTSVGYWSAIMFEQMLRATLQRVGGDPAKVTGAAIEQTVNADYTYKDPIPGGIGTVSFPADETIPSGCGNLVKTVGEAFKLVGPYRCTDVVNVKLQKLVDVKTGRLTSAGKETSTKATS